MRVSAISLGLLSAVVASAFSSDDGDMPSKTTGVPACTATSSTGSGAFFDLRPDMAVREKDSKSHKASVTKDYHVRGWDYGRNFTLNICGSVVEPVEDVAGLDKQGWANVSAYYETSGGRVYSMGSTSLDLQSRGRKLVLQYTGGSPCGDSSSFRRRDVPSLYDDEEAEFRANIEETSAFTTKTSTTTRTTRRKSTTISFLCDRDPSNAQTALSFVGTDPDECAYFFEARSVHACAHAEPHKPGSVGPGSVFGMVLLIAVLVYVLGGVFYNRTVTHSRGWRQLPNYSMWAGIWSFICDMFVIAWSSCARRLPTSRGGYSHLSSSPTTTRNRRDAEAENRLIDQLDEEWED